MTERRTRAVTREIAIAAPVAAVWKALTDAEELTRWFPLHARVEPGAGGRLVRGWQTGDEVEERIECWESDVHLRTVGLSGGWKGIVTDYRLTTSGGSTTLRVVSSGFGADDDWDELYDGFGTGWDFELRGLAHYLEQHAGEPRLVASARAPRSEPARDSWSRFVSPGGWFGGPGLPNVTAGSRYSARVGSGQQISGTVSVWQPPHQLVASVTELNNALMRVNTRCAGESGTALVWLSTYGIPERSVRAIEREWQQSLEFAFGTR